MKPVFVLVDIQEKFIPVIKEIDNVIKNANILLKSAEILKIPIIITEHYSKGLGKTTNQIKLPKHKLIEKIHFDCCKNPEFKQTIQKYDTIILFGIEAHICIYSTAVSLRDKSVYVASDAISSRKLENKEAAILDMLSKKINVIPTESILFHLLEKAGTMEFKAISKLIQ